MRSRLLAALALAVVMQVLCASVALAATPAAPEMDVQLWAGAQAGQAIVIVGTTLPEDTELPVTVRLPVLAGMTIDWAGEIAAEGGQDQQRPYEIKEGEGGQYAEFQISEQLQAQIELSGTPLTVDGATQSAVIDFVQSVPSELTKFSVRVPAGASNVTIEPAPTGTPDQNDVGESLYTLPPKRLDEGDSQRISLGYTVGGADSAEPSGSPDTGTIIALLIGLLILAAAALVFLMRRQNRASE